MLLEKGFDDIKDENFVFENKMKICRMLNR